MIVNGGSIAAVDQDGVHAVAYLGDTSGNGGYSSFDATLIRQVVANISRGFAAYPLLDPTIVADIAGTGSLNSLDATFLQQYVANIAQPRIPTLPGVTITQGGPDPLIWIPEDLGGAPGSTLTVPVDFRQTNGTAIGLDAANLAFEFDPGLFTVIGVRLGDLARGFTLNESFDDATGAIIASARSTSGPIVLAPGTEGTLLLIELQIRPGAKPGPSKINLLGEGRVGNVVMYTSLNDGGLTLTPAPTDSDQDPVDGVVTISGPPTTETSAPLPTVSSRPVPSGPLASSRSASEARRRTLGSAVDDATTPPAPTLLIPMPDADPGVAVPSMSMSRPKTGYKSASTLDFSREK